MDDIGQDLGIRHASGCYGFSKSKNVKDLSLRRTGARHSGAVVLGWLRATPTAPPLDRDEPRSSGRRPRLAAARFGSAVVACGAGRPRRTRRLHRSVRCRRRIGRRRCDDQPGCSGVAHAGRPRGSASGARPARAHYRGAPTSRFGVARPRSAHADPTTARRPRDRRRHAHGSDESGGDHRPHVGPTSLA